MRPVIFVALLALASPTLAAPASNSTTPKTDVRQPAKVTHGGILNCFKNERGEHASRVTWHNGREKSEAKGANGDVNSDWQDTECVVE